MSTFFEIFLTCQKTNTPAKSGLKFPTARQSIAFSPPPHVLYTPAGAQKALKLGEMQAQQ